MRMLFVLAAVGAVGFAAPARAGFVTDGDFSAFAFGAFDTATASREATGGNPGARVNITTVSGPGAFGTAIKTDYVSTAALEGSAFTLSLDVLSGPGAFGGGQAILLLVEQNGAVYQTSLGGTGFPRNFDTLTFSGTFTAADFDLFLGAGPADPNFGGGVATRFGFAAGNSNSGTLTQYYDNFVLESPALDVGPGGTATPAPASAVLFGLGGAVLGWRRRRV